MSLARFCGILALALISSGNPHQAFAEGLAAAAPRRLIVDEASATQGPYEFPTTPFSATPVPLRNNGFVIPFTTTDVSEGGIRSGAARYQVMFGNFTKQGASRYLISGLEGCCTGWAENGGTRFASFSQLVLPLFTFDGDDGREVFGFRVLPNGNAGSPDTTQWLTRHKPGTQGGAVVVPMANGRSFVMWGDTAPVSGGSAASVRGVIVLANGTPTGSDIAVETNDTGAQAPMDGAQLANGSLILIYSEAGTSDVTGRVLFHGQLMSRSGNLIGAPVLLAASNDMQFGARMRVAALPNGNFVVTWVDDRVGTSVPLFRIFTPELEYLSFAQPFVTYTTAGTGLDVAALADSRFVITGTVIDNSGTALRAQLFSPVGSAVGAPLTLQSTGNPANIAEQHIANAGYLLSTPPPAGGLKTASDPDRVYVTWRLTRPASRYDLYGQLLTATP